MALDAIHDLPLFVVAGLLLNLTPGVDMALVVSRSASQGLRAGAASALGVGAGCMLHTLAAALGISALVASSATAFAVLRWLGAAYLVWLGIAMLRAKAPAASAPTPPPLDAWRLFAQGFLTNALNPKVALFFLAFVPQFIRPDAADQALAFILLGLVFNINGTLVNLAIGAIAVLLRRRIGAPGRWGLWFTRGVGAVFVALGLKLASGK